MKKLIWFFAILFTLTGCGQQTTANSQPVVKQIQSTIQFPKVSDIQSIAMTDDSLASVGWNKPINPTETISQVLEWLKTSGQVSVQFPRIKIKNPKASSAYIGPSNLYLHLRDKETIRIMPVSYIQKNKDGKFTTYYLDGIVGYEQKNNWSYLKSPLLYKWIQEDQWKQDFRIN